MMGVGETIGAAELKTHCLEILDRLSAREVSCLTITKRGRPIAVLVAPDDARDLTAATPDEPLAAGRLHR
jgi:prevent-host-death family protein